MDTATKMVLIVMWTFIITIIVMLFTFYDRDRTEPEPSTKLLTLEIQGVYCVNGFRHFKMGDSNLYLFRNTDGNIVPCVEGERR